MILHGLKNIDEEIVSVKTGTIDSEFTLDDAMIFPGLFNAHDHLHFNLFPALGGKHFENYREWSLHVHSHYSKQIDEVLAIPVALRAQWGLYKNVLCGVTTVAHHGEKLLLQDPPISVLQHEQCLHSVGLEKNWKRKLNDPRQLGKACIIHTGEGTDTAARQEIDELLRWNIFNRKLIGIHGIAMTAGQSKKFRALVWCPVSNDFLYGQTADVPQLTTTLLFGTDSTLTGSWNIWEHLRYAKEKNMVTDRSLYEMATFNPEGLWQLQPGKAGMREKNFVIARYGRSIPVQKRFFDLGPEDLLLVVCKGIPLLFDESLLSLLKKGGLDESRYDRVIVGNAEKWVRGPIISLMKAIQSYCPSISFPVYEQKPVLFP